MLYNLAKTLWLSSVFGLDKTVTTSEKTFFIKLNIFFQIIRMKYL